MPSSPLQVAEGVLGIAITADGAPLPDHIAVLDVRVRLGVNRIPEARLVFADGGALMDGFPVSDGPTLAPGTTLRVEAGYGDARSPIFSGVVVRQALSIQGAGPARLEIVCRAGAAQMDIAHRSARYLDMDNGDILRSLIVAHGLKAAVSASGLRHGTLLQHDCTDWQFLLARAAAQGCVVGVADGMVTVAPPRSSTAAVLSLTYGIDVIEFEADVGGPAQSAAGRPLPRGRVSFQGSALAVPDCCVELANLGDRFNGAAWVRGVRHHLEAGEWRTEVDFCDPAEVTAPGSRTATSPGSQAAGPTPSTNAAPVGLFRGRVTQLESDPAGEHRIQVSLPGPGLDSLWARLVQFQASAGFGAHFVPDIGDEVLVGFLAEDSASPVAPVVPVVLGSLYSRDRPPTEALSNDNAVRSLITRGQSRLVFDDRDQTVTVGTAAGNQVVLDDRDGSIQLTDSHGNRVHLGAEGLTLSSARDIRLAAPGSITLAAGAALSLGSQGDARLNGLNVSCEGQVGVRVRGAVTAELSADGQTTVRGAMVMIN